MRDLHARSFDVFPDLKFHDIPNITAQKVAMMVKLGIWMVNIYAIGGAHMMAATKEALLPYCADAADIGCRHRVNQHGAG